MRPGPSLRALALLLSLLPGVSKPASSVAIDWSFVGDPANPGNACDDAPICFGAVGYAYSIGTYEVTNAQYAEFLNARAVTDPLELYHPDMASTFGGITRSGDDGSYSYAAIPDRAQRPVNRVSFYDALRFANWLHNGQASGDTETGAYTLLGGTPTPSNGATVTRNPSARIFLPSEDEWFKAAYYDRSSQSYFNWPAGSNGQIACTSATSEPNSANCSFSHFGDVSDVGSYTGSASPYGTFDQGGNLVEWNEAIVGTDRVLRGGTFSDHASTLGAGSRYAADPASEGIYQGFRVASIPEPGSGLLVTTGLLGLACWHRRHAGRCRLPSPAA